MASVYYGDEAGLTGHDDPDDRRPYPWDAVDTELRDWYRTLGQLRLEHASLRTGDLEFLHADDAAGTLAYLRRDRRRGCRRRAEPLHRGADDRPSTSPAGCPTGAVLADAIVGDVADGRRRIRSP